MIVIIEYHEQFSNSVRHLELITEGACLPWGGGRLAERAELGHETNFTRNCSYHLN